MAYASVQRFQRGALVLAAAALAVVTLSPGRAAAQNPEIAPQLAQKGTAAIAEEAYLYGFPMIVGYQVMYQFNIDRASGQFKARFNTISNEARVFTPKDTTLKAPNSDTPYSSVQMDLRSEPMVLCMPEIEQGRYYDVQLADMYTFNYGYMGTRTTGNGAGCYLVAGPDWQGETPPGVRQVFRSETQFSMAAYLTQLFSPDDIDNVKRIQAGYKVQPLSAFLGRPAPPPAPTIDWPKFEQDAFTTKFGEYLSFLLQFCPPVGAAAVEKPLREEFARIGIAPRSTSRPETLSPEMKAAFAEAIRAASAKIEQTMDNLGANVNGWRVGSAAGDRAFFNGNWALRAAGAKLGIYGNSQEEAVYPFALKDLNGHVLDGGRHNYTMTFGPGQLPPVRAFWSVTMYDANTLLLIDNPINRYLINSGMEPQLKKNIDGSITIYVQKDLPGKEKESNWLPAPDGPLALALRLYWPKSMPPSIFPLGEGSWKPPAVVPLANLRAEDVKRFGDKSLESVIRTDDRYGHDDFFEPPRGWPYWNYLENPLPVQDPNLWPDMQSTYFFFRFAMPGGSAITFRGQYPHVRYFGFSLYKREHNTYVSTGEALAGAEIEADAGSTNPFLVGADRLAAKRDYRLRIVAEDLPQDPAKREKNTLYAGRDGAELQGNVRIYLPDKGWDGAGLGPATSPFSGRGLPSYEATLADGTRVSGPEMAARFVRPMTGNVKPPFNADQWFELVHAKDNDPALTPATAPAREEPKWRKFWTLRYSLFGAFKSPEERAKIPFAGAAGAGADPSTQYMVLYLSRKFGPVYVMRGKMPTFPDTYTGAGGKGLEVMPATQTQYWSLVSCEAPPSGQVVDGLIDMQVPLDKDGNYTIVYSRKEDQPKNATVENGVAWIEWSPRGEGIDDPRNRSDFGMLMLRMIADNPSWAQSANHVGEPGMEEAVMGPYYPRGYYTDKAKFEAEGPRK